MISKHILLCYLKGISFSFFLISHVVFRDKASKEIKEKYPDLTIIKFSVDQIK